MKITCVDTDAVLAEITLGDDSAGDWIVDPPMLPLERRNAQVTPLFRGANPFARGRGNRTVTFQWIVLRDHGTSDAAGTFLRAHAAAVPINVTLTVDDGAGEDTYTAVMNEVAAVDRWGRSTVFRYAVVGAVWQAPG